MELISLKNLTTVFLLFTFLEHAGQEYQNERQKITDSLSSSNDPILMQAEEYFKHSDYESACSLYKSAFAQGKGSARDHINYGECLLACGQLKKGFLEREWRLKVMPSLKKPWDGTDALGKTILVRCHGDGGLGDTFFFASRWGAELYKRGARVIFLVQKPLLQLMSQQSYVYKVIVPGQEEPPYDYDVYMMSLPCYISSQGFKPTTQKTIVRARDYLTVNGKITGLWKNKLAKYKKMYKIAICWRASPLPGGVVRTYDRDISLAPLLRVLYSLDNVYVISVQGGGHRPVLQSEFNKLSQKSNTEVLDDKDCLPEGLQIPYQVIDENGPFIDTVGVIANCDLVISVETVIACLAAAMGKQTIVLLSKEADWRRFTEDLCGLQSPWDDCVYHSWQKKLGDWDSAFLSLKNIISMLRTANHDFFA